MNTKTTKPFEMWTAWDCLGRHDCRPVIVISQEGDTDAVTVIPLTSDRESTQLPTHVLVSEQGLDHTSRALCEKVKTIRRKTLIRLRLRALRPFCPPSRFGRPSRTAGGGRHPGVELTAPNINHIIIIRRYDP